MKNIKVLTVKNPYAFLILAGIKKYEIRSWSTKYRGPLYIHSAKVPIKEYDVNTVKGISRLKNHHISIDLMAMHGYLLGKVELVDIKKIGDDIPKPQAALDGCCSIDDNDKYAWVLHNPEIASLTIPVQGKLGLWSLETDGNTDN